MEAYVGEVEKYINSFRNHIEAEKKEIAESQKKISKLKSAFSQETPSNSVINSLFKDEEPEGFVFSKYEDKRKHLAEQRRAEYNAYLEKKEAERLSKQRKNEEKRSVSPKSLLDAVDYERVLAKRKEEEAKFRTMNHADVLHSSRPVLRENVRKPSLDAMNNIEKIPPLIRTSSLNFPVVNLPGAVTVAEDPIVQVPKVESKSNFAALERENTRLLEERIAKHLEEQRRQMLLDFENELRKSNEIKEELETLKASTLSKSPPQSLNSKLEELPMIGRTGGGGDPVRDSFGNLLTMRGLKKESNSVGGSIMSFPSMQQQPTKDRITLYREELQKQIEDKKRLEALERAKARELEDRLAQRAEEQRLKMQQEYEKEHQKKDKISEEFQRQQERARQLEEFQRKDAEARRKKLIEMRPPELEKPEPKEVIEERSNSPPIPAVRTKVLFEKVAPAIPEVKPENVFSGIAEIRRKLKEEQQKPKKEKSYEVMNRRTVQDVSDDDDDDLLKTSYPGMT